MSKLSINTQLLFAQNAISNAQNQEVIKNLLAEYGYDDAKLQEGRTLYEEAQSLNIIKDKEYGEQYDATSALDLAKTEANKEYMKHVKVARIAFKGNVGASEALQISGRRSVTFSGWIKQAKSFYANILSTSGYLQAMAAFGITQEKLEASQAKVLDVEVKYNMQLKEKGEAQHATVARDIALDQLNTWVSDFVAISRIALEENPQYLEMLGIIEPAA